MQSSDLEKVSDLYRLILLSNFDALKVNAESEISQVATGTRFWKQESKVMESKQIQSDII
jgi:hypothetical protein